MCFWVWKNVGSISLVNGFQSITDEIVLQSLLHIRLNLDVFKETVPFGRPIKNTATRPTRLATARASRLEARTKTMTTAMNGR